LILTYYYAPFHRGAKSGNTLTGNPLDPQMFGDRAEAGRACPVFVNIRFGSTGRYKATSLEGIEALLLLREKLAEKDIT
jgi:hypothetical protein